ncbi:alpha/beta hydrolase [Niallia endozanthoxylica]|uniref:Esterase n=1 Tax=Niallia endozanthoxylica TaxID=2036016 RepID=A0A5J5H3L3_9BACI|nr:esterase [Niallia endozanthoxylica]KAA9014518.1 esterase [Niallia endozanthoxylica]
MNAPMFYELKRPKSIIPNRKYPALFLIHGRGSNERNMFDVVGGLEDNFFIFSIRGHIPQSPGYSFFTFKVFGQPDREGFDEGVSLITSFIDYASEQYPIDENGLYFLGFSQGAVMSMTLALTLGHKIKGIVALSGYIPQFVLEEYDRKPVDGLSVFISHGEKDPVLPYRWGVAAQEYFNGMNAAVSFYSYQEGHTVSFKNQEDFKLWLLKDLKG